MGDVKYMMVDRIGGTVHQPSPHGHASVHTLCGIKDVMVTRTGSWKFKKNVAVTCLSCIALE
jgi:hypothetical protein